MESFLLSSSSLELVEMANEELQILQTQHPDRFGYLKLELESFIFQLLRERQPPPIAATTSSSVALTQVSSTRNSNNKNSKKRKNKESCGSQSSSAGWMNNKKKSQRMIPEREDRVDIVLERAQLCLQKIKDVKSSLF